MTKEFERIPEIAKEIKVLCASYMNLSITEEEFISKINRILQPEIYSQMRVAARNSYLERFTIDKMIAGYLSVFSKIYNRKNI